MVVIVCSVLVQKSWSAKYLVTWNTWGDRQMGIFQYLVMGICWSRDPQGFQHEGHSPSQPPTKLYLLDRGVVAHQSTALPWGARPQWGIRESFPLMAAMVVMVILFGCSLARVQTIFVQCNRVILSIVRKLLS
jgi:hypothetical protein